MWYNISMIFKHEHHKGGAKLSDFILGAQDGLVNVLGVILGVAAASNDSRIVIAGGLAAAIAESISMAAVAYTSTHARADYYTAERKREELEVKYVPQMEREEVRQIFIQQGLGGDLLEKMVEHTVSDKKRWVDFMMAQELHLAPVLRKSGAISAVVVGLAAIFGSVIPLTGFFFFPISTAIILALVLAALFLFVLGMYQALTLIGSWWKRGLELMIIGLVSAIAGYGIGLLFS